MLQFTDETVYGILLRGAGSVLRNLGFFWKNYMDYMKHMIWIIMCPLKAWAL